MFVSIRASNRRFTLHALPEDANSMHGASPTTSVNASSQMVQMRHRERYKCIIHHTHSCLALREQKAKDQPNTRKQRTFSRQLNCLEYTCRGGLDSNITRSTQLLKILTIVYTTPPARPCVSLWDLRGAKEGTEVTNPPATYQLNSSKKSGSEKSIAEQVALKYKIDRSKAWACPRMT